ncbi:rasGEF domain-containing protein [Naegleria gruberi]|uniref:RasGEF domain-containing protein n=1 Tax=Naegleria gruberi TaxID=5762 RepID=D2VIC6_NAEGR|nr:rasGEF domain-containing protein [Naegleria gruberi]EFC43486.1 rasGEF domain-containing protein [Naegleria gruberi]|eukprot:XP_002676230.1 rasGEF domain-containing protein [Naegleria gruberi strain NEG-M]
MNVFDKIQPNSGSVPPPSSNTTKRPKSLAAMLSRNRSSTSKFDNLSTTITNNDDDSNNTANTTSETNNNTTTTPINDDDNTASPSITTNTTNTTTPTYTPTTPPPPPPAALKQRRISMAAYTQKPSTTTINTANDDNNNDNNINSPPSITTTSSSVTNIDITNNNTTPMDLLTTIDCKQNNIEVGSSSVPSTPTTTTGSNVSTPTGTKPTTATATAGNRKSQKPAEVLNPQDFYSVDLSQLTYTPDPDSSIVIQENQIEHASLNKLIEELTSHTNYDIHFLHTFMLTFRNFTDKETILKKLEERFNYPPNCPPEEFATFKREILDKVRLRIINSIKYWIENFFVFDFDSEMMQFLSKFIEMVRKSNQNALAKVIENTLERVKNNDSGKVITKVECPEILKLKKKVFSKKKTYSILDYPLQEVARQMSLIDYTMFKKIEPKECLNQAWNKEHRVTKAPNISRMIQHFNQFSGFVATEILKQEDHEKRVKCVEKFIELANHCKGLNNFNAVFSVMSGLNSSSIHRLSKTWEAISEEAKKTREELLSITNTNGNFANLRNMLKTVNPPCVPYNGVFLTDLTFIEDGSPKYINGLINFGKCRLFAKVIRDIQTYQNTRYNFEEYKELKDQIEAVEKLSDDELFNMSLQVQPRAQKKKKVATSTANASASSLKEDDEENEKKPEKLDF